MGTRGYLWKVNIGCLIANAIFALGIFIYYYVFFFQFMYEFFSIPLFIFGLSPLIQYGNSIKKIHYNIRDDEQKISLILNALFFVVLVLILIEQIILQNFINDLAEEKAFTTGFLVVMCLLALPMFHNILISVIIYIMTAITKRVKRKYIFEMIICSIALLVASLNSNDLTVLVTSYIIIDVLNIIFLFIPN